MIRFAAKCVSLLLLSSGAWGSAVWQEFNFKVMLDDREIGFHRFRVERSGARETVNIDADFKVSFLGIDFYRYGHRNREVWRDGCLESIRSSTDDNGDDYRVAGSREQSGFKLTTLEAQYELDDSCVMTFAYWNKDFLEQKQLLDAQTGEYLPVDVEFEGNEELRLAEEAVSAKRYRLSNAVRDVDITVWYASESHDWLALESRTGKGKRIRYLPVSADELPTAEIVDRQPEADPDDRGGRR